MFAVVVTIFMVCWAPYHMYFIYSYHNPNITKIPYISHIYLAFYWLAMSNTCVNPIIYYWMNRRFRQGTIFQNLTLNNFLQSLL